MMEAKNTAISLFKYIMELYSLKYQVISDVSGQEWVKFISAIHKDEKNILVNYMDRTVEEIEKGFENTVLLQVTKPEFEKSPYPPQILNSWIKDGWDRFNVQLEKIEKKAILNNKVYDNASNDEQLLFEKEMFEFFDNSKERINAFSSFKKERDVWISHQIKIDKTRKLFAELHLRYIDLDRDSETLEMMIGQGLLECEMSNGRKASHPILLKKVSMEFDAVNNIIRIVDADTDPEIYTMLLQGIDFIEHSSVKTLKEQLLQEYYHPLDRNDTPDFLKSLAHRLHSESRYVNDGDTAVMLDDKLLVFNKPVFFIRKRTGGVVKAIEEIINQIEETGEVSGPILNLIGDSTPQLEEIKEIIDISESLSAISGEDKEILLSKEANREQLEIAKRIENYNAVLVQGPPGTGKTHTIANLMGHFLAQGKSVLVTSHTKKALAVVKEKVAPELQNLCVSVLDDNSKDMERSIDGITDFISSHSSLELLRNTEKLKISRENILEELENVRKKIFAIKHKEFETIVFGGESFSPAQAAKFVYDNKEDLSYIPGKVILGKPLPVTHSDLALLYKTNEIITQKEELELITNLPNPNFMLLPQDFDSVVKEELEMKEQVKNLTAQLKQNVDIEFEALSAKIDGMDLCIDFNKDKLDELKQYLFDTVITTEKLDTWCIYAVLDGKKGGGFKLAWETLIRKIEETYNFASENVIVLLGKKIEGEINESNQTVSTLLEMKEYISKGKKINSLSFLKPKSWMAIYNKIKINSNSIESINDCDVLIGYVELEIKRKDLANLWNTLIEKAGGINFNEFGSDPEQVAISHVEKIKKCISWHDEVYSKIKLLVSSNSLNNAVLAVESNYMSALEEIDDLLNASYNFLPKYIEIALNIYYNLSDISKKIFETKKLFTEKHINSSAICKNLLLAIEEKDGLRYKSFYDELSELYAKYHYINERNRILSDVFSYAPEWAEMIKNRTGMHGESIVPVNIEDAWKWKQFAGTINEITAMPFEELQHKSVALTKGLRMATAKLAKNLAWYHLLCRIEKDLSQKQALQGWKLTVKKIGKGTGKTAPALRREAQKLMAKCQKAVPAWVMPINKALESLDPKSNKFDILIIDEASQSDISALAIIYLAKKIIIVGDDEQVSPSAIGIDVDKMANLANMYIKGIIPNAHLYDMKSSLYDISKTTFPTLMLREHFRCVPNIIGYSNRLSYDFKIKPLRDDSNVSIKPATISYRVADGVRSYSRKINVKEAEMIVALMLACMEFDEYKNMTFGAISLLGIEQAIKINELAIEKILPIDFEKRKILCGDASHFQGDERDVIFLSTVDNNEGEAPLRLTGEGIGKSTKQRYNVAASRAKNQLWVIHSLDVNADLKPGDMRRDLIEYVTNPGEFSEKINEIKSKSDSPFEVAVVKALVLYGYHIIQQWKVGSYSIDMVAVCGDSKIAIECDGELYHSGEEKIREDMERQAILERLGWRFIRIRGSEYFGNPDEAISRVVDELTAFGIEPESVKIEPEETTQLKEDVIIRAEQIMEQWKKERENNKGLKMDIIIDIKGR